MEIDKKEIKRKNILVIGGGIMGLGSAWYLSQRWLKVEIHFLWILATNIVYTKKFWIQNHPGAIEWQYWKKIKT